MADVVFNGVKGRVKYYCELPAANDALILVPLEASGLEADATLVDYDDLATLIAGSSNEQTTLGRKTITAVTVTVDDTNDRLDIDIADQTYTASAGNRVGAVLVCYDPDTTGGTDSSIIPLTKHDAVFTPDGTDVTIRIPADSFYRAT
jgi:hypothetical protein